MNRWSLFFILMCGLIRLLFFYNYLIILLSIELIIITIYFIFLFFNTNLNYSFDLIFLLISMIIVERVFGLRLLISFSHGFGNDYIFL